MANSTKNEKISSRPKMINVGLVDSMGAVREEDRRVSIRELSDRIDAGRTTTDVILKARLK